MPVPQPKAFWPLRVTAGQNDRVSVHRTAGGVTYHATVAAATYYSVAELLAAVVTALTAVWANGWSATTSAAGRVTIAGTESFALLEAGNVMHAVLGFTADTAAGLAATGPLQHQHGWYAQDPVEDDTGDLPSWTRAQARALGGPVKSVQFGGPLYDRSVRFRFLPEHKVFVQGEGSSHVHESLERLIESGWARFRWWADASSEEAFGDYVLDLSSAQRLLRDRLSPGAALYAYPLKFLRYVFHGDEPLAAPALDAWVLYQ